MSKHDDNLDKLSEQIADEGAIEWQGEGADNPELAKTLQPLRDLEAISKAYGSSWQEAEAEVRSVEVAAKMIDGRAENMLFRWGLFEVREEIGIGSFGRVYRAYDPGLAREVALKLRPAPAAAEDRDRALNEARRLASVNHPHVLRVYGVEIHDDQVGLWAELLTGNSLAQDLRTALPYSAREVAGIGLELCSALSALHQSGIMHGDVKAANVMRDGGGNLVLLDLGSGASMSAGEISQTSASPLTSAPEKLAGKKSDARSDVYSLGVLLYRLLTREYPVWAKTVEGLQAQHEAGAIASLRDRRTDLSPTVVAVIEKALQKNPAERYPSCGAFESALQSCLTKEAGRQTTGRKRWIGGGVVVLTALVFALFLPAKSLEVEAGFFQTTRGVERSLVEGDLLRVGDPLFMEFTASQNCYVYILNEDESGSFTVLFPVPGLSPQNPLSKGVDHRLPGSRAGESQDWQMTSNGGEETVLIIASRTPLEAFERQLLAYALPQSDAPLQYAQLDAEKLQTLRGIAGLTASAPVEERDGGGELAQFAAEYRKLENISRGIWVQEIHLRTEN